MTHKIISQSFDSQNYRQYPLATKKFIIASDPWNDGLGDITFIEKIATYLHESSHVPLNNIKLVINYFNKEHFKSTVEITVELLEANYQFPLVVRLLDHENEVQEMDLLVNELKPDVIIQGPGYPTQIKRMLPSIASGEIVYIEAKEYNWSSSDGAAPLGIGLDNFGVFIDPELQKSSQEDHTGSNTLRHIQNLSPEIQKLILGSYYSEETIERFHNDKELFFGHTHSSVNKLNFVAAVSHERYVLEGEDKSLYFCFPGEFRVPAAQMNYIIEDNDKSQEVLVGGEGESLSPTMAFADLKATGAFSIEIINKNGPKKTIVLNADADPKKTIHMICLGQIPHSAVLNLIKASEEESIGTGDQSASELFSAKKHFIYETCDHKVAFADAQIALAKKINEDFGESLRKSVRASRLHKGRDVSVLDSAEFLYRGRQEPEFRRAWNDYNTEVCEEHRFGPKFEQLIEERVNKQTESEKDLKNTSCILL